MNNGKQKVCIGIDVSKDTLDIFYESKSYKISNTKNAIVSFIETHIKDTSNTLCVMENTGGYERLAEETFIKHSIPVHIGHANAIHAFAQACNHFAKTDKLDAILIHNYAVFISGRGENGNLEIDEEHREIIALRRLARSSEEALQAAQCQIKQMPAACTKFLKKRIKYLQAEIASISKEINEKINNHGTLKAKRDLLTSMTGVGEKTATILLAELPELGTLSRGEVAKLVGVAPQTHQSGKKSAAGHIAGGRFYARKSLYMVALVGLRHDPFIKKKYQNFVARGKAKKVAIVALMRDIIIILNSMLKRGEEYKIFA